MYQLKSGFWKSDFKINGKRYQQAWDTTSERVAKKNERELKAKIKDSFNVPAFMDLGFGFDSMMGAGIEQQGMTLPEARDWMIERRWSKLKDSKNPIHRMNRIIDYFGSEVDIRSLNTEVLLKYRDEELIAKENKASKTINHYLTTLKTTIDTLHDAGAVHFMKVPSFKTLRMKNEGNRMICYTKDEEAKMFNELKNVYRLKPTTANQEMLHYFIIQSNLGLRPSELFNLHMNAINFESKTVTIRHGANGDTKNGMTRTLPIDGNCLSSFEFLCRRTFEFLLSKTKPRTSRFTLQNPITLGSLTEDPKMMEVSIEDLKVELSTPLTERSPIIRLSQKMVETRWNKMKENLGWVGSEVYKDYVVYGLRHTVASRLAGERSCNAHQIMAFMGHKDMQTSLKYVHLNVNDLDNAVMLGNQSLKV